MRRRCPLGQPPFGATGVGPNNVLLTWSNPSGTTAVDVYLDTVNPPVNKVVNNVLQNAYGPVNLSASTTYYWRVDVRNANGYTTTGSLWQFSTP